MGEVKLISVYGEPETVMEMLGEMQEACQ